MILSEKDGFDTDFTFKNSELTHLSTGGESGSSKGGLNAGAIAGIVIAVLLVLVAIIVLVIVFLRRKKQAKTGSSDEGEMNEETFDETAATFSATEDWNPDATEENPLFTSADNNTQGFGTFQDAFEEIFE